MSMRIDLLLRKFGFKGDQEDSSPIEDTMQTIFEQLNELEIVWEDSSIGWLLLLTEQLHDTEAFNRLVAVVKAEVAADPDFACFRDDEALSAIIITAINEATNLKGQMCMECCGSGEIDHGDNTETCPKCKDGYLPWTDERRYELFVQLYSSPYSEFTRYKPMIGQLVDQLSMEKLAALLAIKGRIEKENKVDQKVA